MGRQRIPENKKLAAALSALHDVLGSELGVVRGNQLKQSEREILQKNGFLQEIIKGWYFVSDPTASPGDTTPFFANYWEYVSRYLQERFGDQYCLSPEHSLLMHAENNVIPKQINILTSQNATQKVDLYDDYSLIIYPGKSVQDKSLKQILRGVCCLTAPVCLTALGPRFFQSNAGDIQIVMSKIGDPSEIAVLAELNAVGVGRLIGAYRQIGDQSFADGIQKQLDGLPIKVVVTNSPFDQNPIYHLSARNRHALYSRIKLLWSKHRNTILAYKPKVDAIDVAQDHYLAAIESLKIEDAYHSLSIERYRVTPELIQKIADGQWNSDSPEDKSHIAAMAAKGYLLAFSLVKGCAGQAYAHQRAAADLFVDYHQAWFRQLFAPSVDAGILKPSDLIGYRRHMVFLRGSLHSPPHFDHVLDGMEALKECMVDEGDTFVRATLSHWLLGYIHPFMDGNGRMARFTMNLMLAEGGYPWTVIRVDDREAYMEALEIASAKDDLEPFARFLADRIVLAHSKIANIDYNATGNT
jgi:prophage maintenance system killer protein